MPTEKARGVQTIRMCEGFSKNGWEVKLAHANRKQVSHDLIGQSVSNFYAVQEPVDVASVPYLDTNPLVPIIGAELAKPFLIFSNLSFSIVALIFAMSDDSDIFITRDWPVAVALVMAGIPTVYSAHTVHAKGFSSRAQKIFKLIAESEPLKLVVANSRGTADGMSDLGVPEEKILTIPNAVDISDYEPEIQKYEARKQVGLPLDKNLAIYTGSLFVPKGSHLLAKASAYFEGEVILVGGKPDEVEEMRDFVRKNELSDVTIVGHVKPRLVPLYQFAADVLVLPPLAGNYERRHQAEFTSPLKLFEYMAARRPIIASRLSSIEDILTHDENALLVEPGDPKVLGEGIGQLLNDSRRAARLTDNAAETVRQYTWEARAAKILDRLSKCELTD